MLVYQAGLANVFEVKGDTAMQTDKLDQFTLAYITAALWSSTGPPFGDCPQCGKPGRLLCRWDSEQEPVCEDCSETETNYEPPLDDNYDITDLAPETLARMAEDCRRFQVEAGDAVSVRKHPQYTPEELAGHDFWLTRAGHGAGFWDGDWPEPEASQLDTLAKGFGECDLYVGDDGKVCCA